MDRKKAEKLMGLHEQGYMVMVKSHYVDGPVKRIYEKGDRIVYDSAVYVGRDFGPVWDSEVTVWENITDWDVDVDPYKQWLEQVRDRWAKHTGREEPPYSEWLLKRRFDEGISPESVVKAMHDEVSDG